MTNTLTISVITVNFNHKDNLVRTIESVTGQTFKDFEYIVVDGGSTDGSADLIKTHVRVNNWISEIDNGIYDAMNKGVTIAKGEYILFLNSGDTFYDSDVLKDVADELKDNNFPHILFGNVALTKDGRQNEVVQSRKDCDITSVFYKPINHQSIFASKGTLTDKFNTQFRMLADYNWFMSQAVKTDIRIVHIDRIISRYDVKGFSASNKELLMSELTAVRLLYFRKPYVWLLSRMKGTKLMYLTRVRFLRKILNKTILKTRIGRELVANV